MKVKLIEIKCEILLRRLPSDFVSYQIPSTVANWSMTCPTPGVQPWCTAWHFKCKFCQVCQASGRYSLSCTQSGRWIGGWSSVQCSPWQQQFSVNCVQQTGPPQPHPWPPLIPIISLWLTEDLMLTQCWKENWGFGVFYLGVFVCLFPLFLAN